MKQTDYIEYVIQDSSWKEIFHKLKKQTEQQAPRLSGKVVRKWRFDKSTGDF